MNKNFEFAFKETLGYEGGYSDDPNDKGGKTKFGVTEVELKRSYNEGIVDHCNVKELTLDDAKVIYKDHYWDKISGSKINNKYIAAELFDTSVNMGPRQAIKIVQRALEYLGENLQIDGIIGPITIGLINKWCIKDPKTLYIILNCEQYMIYKIIIEVDPSQRTFARGWIKRIQQWLPSI
jgi:lysozyme family protein